MAATETAYFRGQGGAIHAMDLPLPEVMAEQVTKGYLVRVTADGTPYAEPADDGQEPAPPPRPAQSAAKAEWVGYAVRAHGATPDDAEAMTKQDLIDTYGRDGG